MTGSSNDECWRRQQVDSIVWYFVSPLLSQRDIPSTTSFQCSREWKTRKSFLSFTTVSFLSIPPLCVCVCTQHSCSISSGFSPCYPLKKEKKLKTGFQLPLSRRHTVLTADIFHTSRSKARDAIYSATGEEQTNQSAMKTTRVRAFKKWNKQLQFRDVLQH